MTARPSRYAPDSPRVGDQVHKLTVNVVHDKIGEFQFLGLALLMDV